MPPSKKQIRSNNRNSRRNHWKNIARDSRGRWIKQKGKISSIKPRKNIFSKDQGVKEILKIIEKDFNKNCPRCSGDMKYHTIRCGPEKLVKVRRCNICNFWLPITKTA